MTQTVKHNDCSTCESSGRWVGKSFVCFAEQTIAGQSVVHLEEVLDYYYTAPLWRKPFLRLWHRISSKEQQVTLYQLMEDNQYGDQPAPGEREKFIEACLDEDTKAAWPWRWYYAWWGKEQRVRRAELYYELYRWNNRHKPDTESQAHRPQKMWANSIKSLLKRVHNIMFGKTKARQPEQANSNLVNIEGPVQLENIKWGWGTESMRQGLGLSVDGMKHFLLLYEIYSCAKLPSQAPLKNQNINDITAKLNEKLNALALLDKSSWVQKFLKRLSTTSDETARLDLLSKLKDRSSDDLLTLWQKKILAMSSVRVVENIENLFYSVCGDWLLFCHELIIDRMHPKAIQSMYQVLVHVSTILSEKRNLALSRDLLLKFPELDTYFRSLEFACSSLNKSKEKMVLYYIYKSIPRINALIVQKEALLTCPLSLEDGCSTAETQDFIFDMRAWLKDVRKLEQDLCLLPESIVEPLRIKLLAWSTEINKQYLARVTLREWLHEKDALLKISLVSEKTHSMSDTQQFKDRMNAWSAIREGVVRKLLDTMPSIGAALEIHITTMRQEVDAQYQARCSLHDLSNDKNVLLQQSFQQDEGPHAAKMECFISSMNAWLLDLKMVSNQCASVSPAFSQEADMLLRTWNQEVTDALLERFKLWKTYLHESESRATEQWYQDVHNVCPEFLEVLQYGCYVELKNNFGNNGDLHPELPNRYVLEYEVSIYENRFQQETKKSLFTLSKQSLPTSNYYFYSPEITSSTILDEEDFLEKAKKGHAELHFIRAPGLAQISKKLHAAMTEVDNSISRSDRDQSHAEPGRPRIFSPVMSDYFAITDLIYPSVRESRTAVVSGSDEWEGIISYIRGKHATLLQKAESQYDKWIREHPLFVASKDLNETALPRSYLRLLQFSLQHQQERLKNEVLLESERSVLEQEIHDYQVALDARLPDWEELPQKYDALYEHMREDICESYYSGAEQEHALVEHYLNLLAPINDFYDELVKLHPGLARRSDVLCSLETERVSYVNLAKRQALRHLHPDKAFDPGRGEAVMKALDELINQLSVKPDFQLNERVFGAKEAGVKLAEIREKVPYFRSSLSNLEEAKELKKTYGSYARAIAEKDRFLAEYIIRSAELDAIIQEGRRQDEREFSLLQLSEYANLSEARKSELAHDKHVIASFRYKVALLYLLRIAESGTDAEKEKFFRVSSFAEQHAEALILRDQGELDLHRHAKEIRKSGLLNSINVRFLDKFAKKILDAHNDERQIVVWRPTSFDPRLFAQASSSDSGILAQMAPSTPDVSQNLRVS